MKIKFTSTSGSAYMQNTETVEIEASAQELQASNTLGQNLANFMSRILQRCTPIEDDAPEDPEDTEDPDDSEPESVVEPLQKFIMKNRCGFGDEKEPEAEP